MKKLKREIVRTTRKYINIEENSYELVKVVSRDRNFNKLHILKHSSLGIEIRLLLYIWENRNHKNLLIINHEQLAERLKTTRQTISNHLKAFIKDDLIKYKKPGYIFVNPMWIYKGTAEQLVQITANYQAGRFE